jgi:hypothetical protein
LSLTPRGPIGHSRMIRFPTTTGSPSGEGESCGVVVLSRLS